MTHNVEPGAGKFHRLPGWIWLIKESGDGLSATMRADAVIAIDPLWDHRRDVCTGCLVHLANGQTFESAAMPHEVEDAILDAMSADTKGNA